MQLLTKAIYRDKTNYDMGFIWHEFQGDDDSTSKFTKMRQELCT